MEIHQSRGVVHPHSQRASNDGPMRPRINVAAQITVGTWKLANGNVTAHRLVPAAIAYAEHRPDYAEAAFRWALELAPGSRVLDLGAGTGKLTAGLVALGAEVTAVEPDPAMLAQLRHAIPDRPVLSPVVPKRYRCRTRPWTQCLPATPCTGSIWTLRAPKLPGSSHLMAILAGLWNILPNLHGLAASQAIGSRDMVTNWHYETAQMHIAKGGPSPISTRRSRLYFKMGSDALPHCLVATFATKAGVLVISGQGTRAVLLGNTQVPWSATRRPPLASSPSRC